MSTIKTTILIAAATLAFATPSFAQNFQGFGAPSWVTDAQTQTQNKPVALKAGKTVKHVKAAH